jgi:DNA-binding response OmpR family regulator
MHKVLIIDDDEVLLALIRNLLEEEGYKVLSTADGPRGITIYKEQRPDLVLLDLGLPHMSGFEVLRKLHSLDQRAKIIIVTGHDSKESADVALRHGASDFVLKPFNHDDLVNRIKSVLTT